MVEVEVAPAKSKELGDWERKPVAAGWVRERKFMEQKTEPQCGWHGGMRERKLGRRE